ncbi:MAG: SDR family oxidoreductase [Proteobacteria bacterium]|nr:SDR family oxidoreductase [Pseudomonadota bacterium]
MIFLTGASGYLGSYVAEKLLREHKQKLAVLIRGKDEKDVTNKLWESLQLHMDEKEFREHLPNIRIFRGDLTETKFGLNDQDWKTLVENVESIIHCAASLNRKSDKVCMNVNMRGTLQLIQLARAIHTHHGLRRFSFVSTVAGAGHRSNEVVQEDASVDWNRSDYDPYARTKKFCEHMVTELLPDVSTLIFRPAIILGDNRFAKTTQFDMAQAFVWLQKLPILPFNENWKLDIVPANYVGGAIADIHQKPNPKYRIYHLSSGEESLNYAQIVDALARHGMKKPTFVPSLEPLFNGMVNVAAGSPKKLGVSGAGMLLKVFLPYLTFNTVFDNKRVVEEVGTSPVPFSDYAFSLYDFVTEHEFKYPYQPLRG